MKTRNAGLKKKSVFYHYLLSYIGLIILACTLLGVILFLYFINEMNVEAERVYQNKLSLIIDDLNKQYEIMQDAALRVSISIYYKPFYLEAQKTNAKDLIDDLAKFSDLSPIVDNYFFFFKDQNILYQKDGVNTFEVYFRKILYVNNPENCIDLIKSVDNNVIIQTMANGRPVLFFAYPVYTVSSRNKEGMGVLCFVIPKELLEDRVKNIVGETISTFSIQYGSDVLMTLDGDFAYDFSTPKLIIVSEEKNFIVSSIYGNDFANTKLEMSSKTGILLIITFSILLIGLGALLAYSNYLPIKRLKELNQKLILDQYTSNNNEIDQIRSIISFLVSIDKHNKQKIIGQDRILKRYIINLLIEEGYSDEVFQMIQIVAMDLTGSRFCMLSINIGVQCSNRLSDDIERFLLLLEDRNKDIKYFPGSPRSNKSLSILAILSKKIALENVYYDIALIGAKCFSNITIGLSRLFEHLNEVPSAYWESQTALGIAISGQLPVLYFNDSLVTEPLFWYDNDQMQLLTKAMQLGNYEQAIYYLDEILGQLANHTQAFMIQRHVFYGILAKIVGTIQYLRLQIDNEKIISAISVHSMEDFKKIIEQLIYNVCSTINDRIKKTNQSLTDDIMKYYFQHYTDYDMSLKALADRFNTSPLELGRIFHEVMGTNFKNHLIMMRIDKAKALLLNKNISVNEVSIAVGYGSVSHFIRTFKKHTGYSPARYRRGGE